MSYKRWAPAHAGGFERNFWISVSREVVLYETFTMLSNVITALGFAGVTAATSTLFHGATIVGFNSSTESFNVIRNGSLLVTDDRIASVSSNPDGPEDVPSNVTRVDVSNQIITPGLIDTHRHLWQTAFKTLASNTTLAEYFSRYGEFASASSYTAEDVYLGQLTGIYESLSSGVTTVLDHAHHTWSNETAWAGLNASVESRARVFWAYTFHEIPTLNYTIKDQFPNFREIAEQKTYEGTPTELGISFDSWGPEAAPETQDIVDMIKDYNVSVLTTHTLMGPWGITNSPSDLAAFKILNTSVPVVFSHASFITATDAQLLRSSNQYLSITPESEMHYGHTHPHSYQILDQAALGVDTHFTYSADILTQARIWLQTVRYKLFDQVLSGWKIATKNPMSVSQAFYLATRSGGLALRRPDLGVIEEGAKADIVIWDAEGSDSMLGWSDPVAAVMLHANAGDALHVLVDGVFVKKDGKLTDPAYKNIRKRFGESAKRIQEKWSEMEYPTYEGTWQSGYEYQVPRIADTLRGEGDGYGETYLA